MLSASDHSRRTAAGGGASAPGSRPWRAASIWCCPPTHHQRPDRPDKLGRQKQRPNRFTPGSARPEGISRRRCLSVPRARKCPHGYGELFQSDDTEGNLRARAKEVRAWGRIAKRLTLSMSRFLEWRPGSCAREAFENADQAICRSRALSRSPISVVSRSRKMAKRVQPYSVTAAGLAAQRTPSVGSGRPRSRSCRPFKAASQGWHVAVRCKVYLNGMPCCASPAPVARPTRYLPTSHRSHRRSVGN